MRAEKLTEDSKHSSDRSSVDRGNDSSHVSINPPAYGISMLDNLLSETHDNQRSVPATVPSTHFVIQNEERYEQAADQLAELSFKEPCQSERAIVSMNNPSVQPGLPSSQSVQTKSQTNGQPVITPAIETELKSLHGNGKSLPKSYRAFFESRLHADFQNVRIHTDQRGAHLAQQLNARAFTMGQNVVFANGQYQPHSREGKHLIAHELAHVIQQDNAQSGHQIQRQESAQRGQQHSPGETTGPLTTTQEALLALQASWRILGPANVNGLYNHQNAVPGTSRLSSTHRYMLFQFWLARTGVEPRQSPAQGRTSYRTATTAERLARLDAARTVATTAVSELGPEPRMGEAATTVTLYEEAYAYARQNIFNEQVEAEIEASPESNVYEAPEVELEQQRRAVADLLSTIDHFLAVARPGTSAAVRMEPHIQEMLRSVAQSTTNPRLTNIDRLPVRTGLLRLRGVLNAINSILILTDEQRRNELLNAEWNLRSTAARARFILGTIEGGVQLTSIIGGVIANMRGQSNLAGRLFRFGSGNTVRNLGWLAAAAQTIHGIAVLIDSESTEEERLQAVFDIAMGSAGLAGAAGRLLSIELLSSWSGPLSVGIAVTAAEVAYLRSQIRGMEQGGVTGGIRQSLNLIEYESSIVASSANNLHRAMEYAQSMPQPITQELQEGAQRQINFHVERLRSSLERGIRRVTIRQRSMPILFQPASWTHLSNPFLALQSSLDAARSPEQLLAVASAYLEAARDLFRHIERTIARTLLDIDRRRQGGVLPHILGGLHSGLAERAAEEQE